MVPTNDYVLTMGEGDEVRVWLADDRSVQISAHDGFLGVSNGLTPWKARLLAAALQAAADYADSEQPLLHIPAK